MGGGGGRGGGNTQLERSAAVASVRKTRLVDLFITTNSNK